ncbi:MAG: HEPN domain-containing protein [Planctomycetota bacterium]
MDDGKRELVRAWLIKARNDLTAAREIGALPDGPLDTAIYHCQQAAEKAVKGFLAFHDHRLERVHDVERLVSLASGYDPRLKNCEEAAITLTPYATAYRYPGESATLEPSRAEFDEALKLATDLLTFVLSVLPKEVGPNG